MAFEGAPGAACWAWLGPGVELRRSHYDVVRAAEAIRSSDYPDAEEFVRRYVLEPHGAEDTTRYFEERAIARESSFP
jgi:hypothetical protein